MDDSKINGAISRVKNCLDYSLKKKYNIQNPDTTQKLLLSHGMAKENFDFIKNVEKIFSNNIADVSLDANANKNETTISGIMNEAAIPVNKVVGYRSLYRKIKEMYGKTEAKRLMGEMFDYSLALADSSKITLPYCFSIDASKIVIEGRNFGMLPSGPAHRLSSYFSALNETVHQLSNHLAGALAVGSLFFDVAHILIYHEGYTMEDLKNNNVRKYIENCFQNFVHSVNHLSRNSVESPFTNISVFDRQKLKTFLTPDNMGWYFDEDFGIEEGNKEEYIIQYIGELQSIFMEFFDKGDPLNGGRNYRFPVVTLNISKEIDNGSIRIMDEDFVKKISKHEIYRYNILVSEGSKVASCCFDGSQKTLVRYENGKPEITSFSELYSKPQKTKYRVLNSGVWSKASIIRVDRNNKKMYEIILSNNKSMIVTEDHNNVTYRGDVLTKDLKVGDYLMFATREAYGIPEHTNENDDYCEGVLIGAYLGDGSGAYGNSNQIHFSMNEKKWNNIGSILNEAVGKICDDTNGFIFGTIYNNVLPVSISSSKLKNYIQKWISGNTCNEKNINLECLLCSTEFRRGIIDGLYETDGGNSNRIYTTSKNMVDSLEAILTTLGKPTIINVSDRTNEVVVIREQEYTRNFPLYCIRWYNPCHKSKQENVYKIKHNSLFFKIESVKELTDYKNDSVYCFTMEDENNPYFTLPNGIITGNCRLLNNFELLEMGGQMNSFGGAGISLGSHRVVTINFNRIALEATSFENYKEILNERIESSSKILEAHRMLIKDLVDAGYQPFMKRGWLRLERMFSTLGVIGIVEAQETLKSKFNVSDDVIEVSLKFLNDKARELTISTGNIYNIEQIPGESMAPKLATVDKMLFGEENVPYELYSNQFVPLWAEANIYERMKVDGKYNQLFTGGGIVHFNLGERVSEEQAKSLIKYAAEVGCEHFALNPVYSECEAGHNSFGKHEECPVCGKKITNYYTRVVGFFVPVSSFNTTRRNWEFPKRLFTSI